MKNKAGPATGLAVLAAALYAVNIPLSKLLLQRVDATMMAAFLYLGAGAGMLLWRLGARAAGAPAETQPLTRSELPWLAAMVVLDSAAPILLMLGIQRTSAANVSLLNNFEIVATSLVAFWLFREVISRRLAMAIVLICAASALLTFEGGDAFVWNQGSVLVLAACLCWGFENNCTRRLSSKSSQQIVVVKGLFSGAMSLAVAFILGEKIPAAGWMAAVLVLGFVSYGLSINAYIQAQKELGAAKTSAYYSIAPFLGALFGMVLLGERPGLQFWAALAVMAAATVLLAKDTVTLQHRHLHTHTHTHAHRHGDLVHTHPHTHQHTHLHTHGADEETHTHTHDPASLPDHNHPHPAL